MVGPAYDAWARRLQRRSPLVWSEADFRNVITRILAGGDVASIVLADSFEVNGTLPVPVGCEGIEVVGAPGVTIHARTGANPVFKITASNVVLRGFDIRADASSGVAVQLASSSGLIERCVIDGVRFRAVDRAGGGFFAVGVDVADANVVYAAIRDCEFQTQMGVTSVGNRTEVLNCRYKSSFAFTAAAPFNTLDILPTYIGNTSMSVSCAGSISIGGGRIENNYFCSITLGAHVGGCSIVGNTGATTIDTSASTGNNRLAGNSGVVTKSLAATDIDDDAPTGRLIRAPQVLTSGTSYSKPSGCKALLVEVIGGGGAGGGGATAASNGAAGAGGQAGGYARKYFDVSSLAGPFAYAVGAGGTAGGAGNNPGNAGGNSTFSDGTTTVTANGGNGGAGMAAGTTAATSAPSSNGVGSNGDVNARGAQGMPGLRFSGTVAASGAGGSGPFGGGGVSRVTASAGLSGSGPGAGGSGGVVINGSVAVAGGAGADGVVIVWEFS